MGKIRGASDALRVESVLRALMMMISVREPHGCRRNHRRLEHRALAGWRHHHGICAARYTSAADGLLHPRLVPDVFV